MRLRWKVGTYSGPRWQEYCYSVEHSPGGAAAEVTVQDGVEYWLLWNPRNATYVVVDASGAVVLGDVRKGRLKDDLASLLSHP